MRREKLGLTIAEQFFNVFNEVMEDKLEMPLKSNGISILSMRNLLMNYYRIQSQTSHKVER